MIIKDKVAEGVQLVKNNRSMVAHARREVIIEAGAIGSPKLLLLSDIGLRDQLRGFNIYVVADLPVGENLQDHLVFDLAASFHYGPSVLEQLSQPDHTMNGRTFWPMLMRPESTGFLKLRSANPADDPVIVPNYYSKSSDVYAMVRAINICKRLLTSAPMVNINAQLIDVVHFNICSRFPFDWDDCWACASRARPRTLHHLSGTCKMGSADDATAVVDSRLRVKGVSGLGVVDSSVMPYIVSANINAAVIMIGDQASDLIRGVCLPPTKLSNMGALKSPITAFISFAFIHITSDFIIQKEKKQQDAIITYSYIL
ncbi:hypothetical protein Btru_017510 [Bulinus truncatus]|nr:hypothetical protein Btru_017510 [Bulinus truncatus]